MATTSSCSSSKYDVFISFRGDDVRAKFISHLRSALDRDNIKSYADDDDLQKGDEVWPSLSQAIKDSQLAIVVFSENYADSKWCLNELVQIVQCRKSDRLVVIPVFYQVDPSHVRKYGGTYGEAISKHVDKDNKTIQDWKAALTEAANISGWDSRSREFKHESQVIEKIVKDVTEKLSLKSPVELKVENHVEIENIFEELKLSLSKNQKIGIWGMGGIGKTTIAKALFSQLFPQYDGVCFLANVREESKRIGQISLCDKLLSELLKEGHHKYNFAGFEYNLKRLGNKKILIVVDDVDSSDQLDDLCRQWDYAGPDSKLIITTRDKHLLSGRVDKIYEVKTWNFAESLELFSLHAFKKRFPQKGYEDLSNKAVDYARGVPLALKVLGSNLYDRSTEFWDCELRKLTKCPNDRIQNVLQVSYHGLDNLQKKIFLDIAFFFKGAPKDAVIRILDASSGVKVLEDKALITISNSGTIEMHDLIQEMGLNIVRGGSEDSGKRSRLIDIEEVSDVLENKKGSDAVEGVQLDLSQIKDLHLDADTFYMMTNLRILRLYLPPGKTSGNVHHSGVLSRLSSKLRYLEWNGYHLKSLPITFCAKMLVEICMPHSHVTELWQGTQDVVNLVRIDLCECKHLKKLPDLSKASNLKWVNLSGCESLCDIHPHVFSFDTVETLILDGCKKLKSVKSDKHLTSLKQISVNGCTSLREFSVSSDLISTLDLKSTGIESLDSSIGRLRNLTALCLPCLGHGNLGNELSFLKYLIMFGVHNCRVATEQQNLHVLFDGLTSLEMLILTYCSNLYELPSNISSLSKLHYLMLDGSSVKTLPASIKLLTNLVTLSLSDCKKLVSLPELPPAILLFNAENCSSLGTISSLTSFSFMRGTRKLISFKNCVRLDEASLHCIMESALLATISAMLLNMLAKQGYGPNTDSYVRVCFPGSRVPRQIKYRAAHSSITINLPSSPSNFVGLTLCAVLSPSPVMKHLGAEIRCQCYMADGTRLGHTIGTTISFNNINSDSAWYNDHVFLWCDPWHFHSILEIYQTGERRVSFEFFITNGTAEHASIRIRECGVSLIFDSQGDLRRLVEGVNDKVLSLELESHHLATSMDNNCKDTNNHEQHLSQHSSCSDDCLVADLSNTALHRGQRATSFSESFSHDRNSTKQTNYVPASILEKDYDEFGDDFPETSSTIQKLDTIPADTSKSIPVDLPIATEAVNDDEAQSEPSPEKEEANLDHDLEVQLDVLYAKQDASKKDPNASVDNREDSERERAQDQNHSQEKNKEEKDPEKEQNQNVQPTCSTKTSGSLSQIDLEMLEKDPFSMLDMWSTNSLPSHGSEACLNTATIDEANTVMAQFRELAFEGDFKIKLITPGFKTELQTVVDKLEKLGKSIPETFKDKVEKFTKIFNQAFEVNKKHNKCTKTIEEIEASSEEDLSKLAQAREEYTSLQKTFQEMEQCLPSLVESEQKLAKEEEEIAKQLKSLQHKLNAIRKQQEDIKAAKLANKEKQETYFSLAKHIASVLKNQLQEKKKLEQEQIDSEKALHALLEAYTNLKVGSEFDSLHI